MLLSYSFVRKSIQVPYHRTDFMDCFPVDRFRFLGSGSIAFQDPADIPCDGRDIADEVLPAGHQPFGDIDELLFQPGHVAGIIMVWRGGQGFKFLAERGGVCLDIGTHHGHYMAFYAAAAYGAVLDYRKQVIVILFRVDNVLVRALGSVVQPVCEGYHGRAIEVFQVRVIFQVCGQEFQAFVHGTVKPSTVIGMHVPYEVLEFLLVVGGQRHGGDGAVLPVEGHDAYMHVPLVGCFFAQGPDKLDSAVLHVGKVRTQGIAAVEHKDDDHAAVGAVCGCPASYLAVYLPVPVGILFVEFQSADETGRAGCAGIPERERVLPAAGRLPVDDRLRFKVYAVALRVVQADFVFFLVVEFAIEEAFDIVLGGSRCGKTAEKQEKQCLFHLHEHGFMSNEVICFEEKAG